MNMIKQLWANKWVKFSLVSAIYILWFVVWTGNLWMLLGEVIIYDLYISKIFHKLFWKKHKEHKKRNKGYRQTAEWVEAILFATVAAMIIRIFIFEMFVIPTPSMEKSLLVGDYLCVSKVAYGPKMPNTPISFPFVHNTMPFSKTKKSYCEAVKWKYHRLKGWGSVKRGDAVVFNFPAGDTVLLERQNETYYDVLRQAQAQYGQNEGRNMISDHYTVVARPVDKRENYVKRCVGIPGDSIKVVNAQLFVNGIFSDTVPTMQLIYFVRTDGNTIPKKTLQDMGISPNDISYSQMERTYLMPLTKSNAERIGKLPNVTGITQHIAEGGSTMIFPNNENYSWSEDNFGPLWVPSCGATVSLTAENLPLYERIIDIYEGNDLEVKEDGIYINGQKADSYTFKMDYYFMMGDNRHNSADSRFWGFVPEDHIVGKPSFVWLSIDQDKSASGSKVRWNRIFRGVKTLQNR